MLEITIPEHEFYIQDTAQFVLSPSKILRLEHSLVSISKWESIWKVPFLGDLTKTQEQFIDYVRCMTITQNVDPIVYSALTQDNIASINAYMDDTMTATTVKDTSGKGGREVVTSELIYYWMISLNIPFECQKWHIKRLITLVKVVNAKQNPKKMNKRDAYTRQRQLNAERRAKLNSTG